MRKSARKDLDFDLDYDDERPAKTAPQAKRARLSATRVGLFGLGALSLAIVVNAAFLQDQRRNAPLFKITLAEEAKPAVAAQPQALPPLPPVRVVDAQPQPVPSVLAPEPPRAAPAAPKVDLIARELNRGAAPAPRVEKPAIAEARVEKPQPRPAQQRTEPRRQDAIGGLIEKTAASSSTKAREPAATDDVRAAQRALQRLGFVVRPSGVFDAATRQAIAQFEREHKMPERGELTPTVKRELARLSSGET